VTSPTGTLGARSASDGDAIDGPLAVALGRVRARCDQRRLVVELRALFLRLGVRGLAAYCQSVLDHVWVQGR
jgi:hypothetical protein